MRTSICFALTIKSSTSSRWFATSNTARQQTHVSTQHHKHHENTRRQGDGKDARRTFKDLWWIKLVRVARFRDRYLGADLEKGRAGGQVADGTRHDHQELRIVSQNGAGPA